MARGSRGASAFLCSAAVALLAAALDACVLVTDQSFTRPTSRLDDVVLVDQVVPPDAAPSPCPAGQTNCGGTCVDLATDEAHCGSCEVACAVPANAFAACVAGRCETRCRDGYGPCHGAACDTFLGDPHSCGGCSTDCSALANGAVCRLGADGHYACALECAAGETACDRTCADTLTDANNCGTCGHACPTGQACAAGHCVCATVGERMCDGACVDTRTDVLHCGGCGAACPTAPHVVTSCVAGACMGSCEPGFANCDGNVATGCETDTRSDPLNCGGCGVACGPGASCVAGACVASMPCPATTTFCGAGCVDLSTDLLNCGACGIRCTSGACAGGVCGVVSTCAAPLSDRCGTLCTDLRIDPLNCGTCGHACPLGTVCESRTCMSTMDRCGYVGLPCCSGACRTGSPCRAGAGTMCTCVLGTAICV